MLANAGRALRPTTGKVIGFAVAACVAGIILTDAAEHQQKQATRARLDRHDHNMDVAMGGLRERIREAFAGFCKGQGARCVASNSDGNWWWFRQSMARRDVFDVVLPNRYEGQKHKVTLLVFMRDKGGALTTVEPTVLRAYEGMLTLLGVPAQAAAECQAARAPVTITTGRLTLTCRKTMPASYQASNGDWIEGSSFSADIEWP